MNKILKYGVITVIVILLILGISSYISSKNAPLKVSSEKVQRKDIATEITSNGKIQPKLSY
jgi:hypothetical protein